MTYFLEKNYELNLDGKVTPTKYGHVVVRSCKDEYETILNAIKNVKTGKEECIIELDGACATYSDGVIKKFGSLEEWLIWLELDRGIVISFEETCILDRTTYKTYVVKTVDFRTKEFIYDKIEPTLDMLKKLYSHES